LTNNRQQADTGTKMIHIGRTRARRLCPRASRPASAEHLSRPGEDHEGRNGARNYTQCDSLLIGDKCGAHTFPYIDVRNGSARMEHEASTSKIGEDQLFYLRQRASRPKMRFR